MPPIPPEDAAYEGNSSRKLTASVLGSPPVAKPQTRPMPISALGMIYLVKTPYRGDPFNGDGPAYVDGSGYVVGCHADLASAEQHRQRLALQWRKDWLANPCFHLHEMTSFPPSVLRDWVLDLGLESPALSECEADDAWMAWWEKTGPGMTDWQRERFLAAMDKADGSWIQEVPLVD